MKDIYDSSTPLEGVSNYVLKDSLWIPLELNSDGDLPVTMLDPLKPVGYTYKNITNGAGGSYTDCFTEEVPENRVWCVNWLAWYHTDTTSRSIRTYMYTDSSYIEISTESAKTGYSLGFRSLSLWLSYGDKISVRIYSLATGKYGYAIVNVLEYDVS